MYLPVIAMMRHVLSGWLSRMARIRVAARRGSQNPGKGGVFGCDRATEKEPARPLSRDWSVL